VTDRFDTLSLLRPFDPLEQFDCPVEIQELEKDMERPVPLDVDEKQVTVRVVDG